MRHLCVWQCTSALEMFIETQPYVIAIIIIKTSMKGPYIIWSFTYLFVKNVALEKKRKKKKQFLKKFHRFFCWHVNGTSPKENDHIEPQRARQLSAETLCAPLCVRQGQTNQSSRMLPLQTAGRSWAKCSESTWIKRAAVWLIAASAGTARAEHTLNGLWWGEWTERFACGRQWRMQRRAEHDSPWVVFFAFGHVSATYRCDFETGEVEIKSELKNDTKLAICKCVFFVLFLVSALGSAAKLPPAQKWFFIERNTQKNTQKKKGKNTKRETSEID